MCTYICTVYIQICTSCHVSLFTHLCIEGHFLVRMHTDSQWKFYVAILTEMCGKQLSINDKRTIQCTEVPTALGSETNAGLGGSGLAIQNHNRRSLYQYELLYPRTSHFMWL